MSISEVEKKEIFDAIYANIVRLNFSPVEEQLKVFAKKHLDNRSKREQAILLAGFISYIRQQVANIPVPKYVIKAAILAARPTNKVPVYLLDSGSAIWGKFLTPSIKDSTLKFLAILEVMQPSIVTSRLSSPAATLDVSNDQ